MGTTEALELLAEVEAGLRPLVARIPPGDLERPSPCSGWDLRALLNHTVRTIDVFAAGADGGPSPTDVEVFDGPDLLGAEPAAVTEAICERSRRAWSMRVDADPGLEAPYVCAFGEMPAAFALKVSTFSTLTHSWDVARALGTSVEFRADALEVAEEVAAQIVGPLRELGRFARPVALPEGADRASRLLAATGRDPR